MYPLPLNLDCLYLHLLQYESSTVVFLTARNSAASLALLLPVILTVSRSRVVENMSRALVDLIVKTSKNGNTRNVGETTDGYGFVCTHPIV